MIFSRNWLSNYVELPGDVEKLAAGLTGAGLAVEGLERRDDDVLLDVDVTTNRPDCMCHLGLARELAAVLGKPLRDPGGSGPSVEGTVPEGVEVEVVSFEDCPRYVARVVRGVTIGASPEWLVERLEGIGVRPVNVAVDVTNYLLWALGQPLHAFDLGALSGGVVRVRRAESGESLVTLDGEERQLTPELLVIADDEKPVALAGVMGGRDSEVSEATTDILIESAHFEPMLVRRASKDLGLHTDASHRFERGADPGICARAADLAAVMLSELAGGQLVGAVDRQDVERQWALRGRLELERLVRFGGVEISSADVERILVSIGFTVGSRGGRAWEVTVPSWRYYDLRPAVEDTTGEVYEADLFEEVLRLYGYDRIESRLPALAGADPGGSPAYGVRRGLRRHLAACGFAEAINYGFYDAAADASFPVSHAERGALELSNPLSDRYSLLRRSLLPGLVESAVFNVRRGAESVRLFEVGNRFDPLEDDEVRETEVVGLVAGGTLGRPWDRVAELDFYDLKGVLESAAELGGVRLELVSGPLTGLAPGSSAEIWVDGRNVGQIGRVDTLEVRYSLWAAQIDIAALGSLGAARNVEIPFRHPGIELDLTLTHALSVDWSAIHQEISSHASEDLRSFGIKDRYRGEGVPEGAVNTTIYFSYNAADHSLTQEEVNRRHEVLAAGLAERFGWQREGTA